MNEFEPVMGIGVSKGVSDELYVCSGCEKVHVLSFKIVTVLEFDPDLDKTDLSGCIMVSVPCPQCGTPIKQMAEIGNWLGTNPS